jgi:outer membrane protein assembly factor BamB
MLSRCLNRSGAIETVALHTNSTSIAWKYRMKLFVTALAILISTTSLVAEDDWPRFRGPDATGVAPDNERLPASWSTTDNVSWVTDVPGWGWSCPIVWGDRVFLTTVVGEDSSQTPSKGLYLGQGVREPAKGEHHWLVYCFDLKTGNEVWKHEAHSGLPKVPRHPKSTYAAETATTDGERLYVLFGDVGLYCYDLDGNPLWSQKIEPKKTFLDYGAAASPVVHDGQVFVVYDNLEGSWIAAFNAETGDENWRKERDESHSWATPLVWENESRTEIVVPGKKRNRSYSLDGELLWEFNGRMSNLVIPSPFAAHGLCYIASGYIGDSHRPTFAIRPGATGDLSPDGDFSKSEHIAWYQGTSSSYNPSQIVYGDYLYTLYDRGFLTCHDAKSGEEVYSKRRFVPRGSFTSSPWAYNGHLFFLSEDGLTYVVKAGPEFEIVGTSDLSELCLSSPAVAGDRLLIRTASALYCLTEGAQLPAEIAAKRMKKTAAPRIWEAAQNGQVDALAKAIAAGAFINAKDSNGLTPLMLAALHGQTKTVKILLKHKADVTIANSDGNTALHMAAFLAHPEIVKHLLASSASPLAKNKKGETPITNVAAEWSNGLAGVYLFVGNLIGEDLDLKRIRETRPVVLKLLRDKVNQPLTISSDALSKAKVELTTAVESGKVAGAGHMVVINGKTVYLEVAGVRDIDDKTPFESDTLLRIYSMTKPITSVAAMTLYEQRKFKLDDPISKYIPTFEKTTVLEKDGDEVKIVPAKRQITVRDAFRHTTGFSYGDGNPNPRKYYEEAGMRYRSPAGMRPPAMTIEQAAEALAKIPALHHPGERFTYGFSTDLLGRLIEVWSSKPLDEYMQEAVFGRLSMKDTGFSIPKDKRSRFASCHTAMNDKLAIIDKAATSDFNDGFEFQSGGGGLVSTMQDYANFCEMLVAGGEFNGQRILKDETVKLMFTDQLESVPGPFRFGLGFAIGEVTLGSSESASKATQYSWGGYASTAFRIVPEEKLIQIVVRQRVPSANGLGDRLLPIIFKGASKHQ